jgi:hypothetical protein
LITAGQHHVRCSGTPQGLEQRQELLLEAVLGELLI